MRALGEGQVVARTRPSHVEPVRLGVCRRISVGGRDRQPDEIPVVDPGMPQIDLLGRVAIDHGRGRLQPQRFLDRGVE
jgi:hypothetical protein